MVITMITPKQLSTLSLPQRVSGRYWLSANDTVGIGMNAAYVEGVQGRWLLFGSRTLKLIDMKDREEASIELTGEYQVISAKNRETGEKYQFYVEPATEDRQIFKKYCVKENCRLNIGRTQDNQIIFDNKYVSSQHAILIWQNQGWSITDAQSRNGTFVNGQRIATTRLVPGDMVYIMGLKIVVGNGFFAVNNPDSALRISSTSVSELARQDTDSATENWEESVPETYQCSLRLSRGIEKSFLTIDPPPPPQEPEETPLALLLGPALTMGLTAVVMAAVAVINLMNGTSTPLTALPTIIMSFSMLCGTLLWPLLTKRSEKKRVKQAETLRQNRYREYLDQVRNEIYQLGETQKTILLENAPSITECEARVLNREGTLWERTIGQRDFLCLRLGIGDVPMDVEIKYPEKRFSVDTDLLQNEVYRMSAESQTLSSAPITCSLLNNPFVGISGEHETADKFLQTLILQIATLHSYRDVKLVFFTEEAERPIWKPYRLLPHMKDENEDMRFFAVGADEQKAVALYLEHVWNERSECATSRPNEISTYYVLIATDISIMERVPLFEKIGVQKENVGFCAITIAQKFGDLPKICSLLIDLSSNIPCLYRRSDPVDEKISFEPELSDLSNVEQICRILGNLVLHTRAEQYTLPKILPFLELYGAGKVEHLNSQTRWKENSSVNSLQVPVGVGEGGDTIYLDLHEKAHGPHGLIAGMTGSGKSEFVITYLLSMAVNYHPDEVAFILIDYKGGGLAGAFEDATNGIKIPHLAGTITNLDGASVNRALISIQSELRRRQGIFNRAKELSGSGTMDIYKYQKLFRSGVVTEAIPHLLIVSDEFAELKTQRPDFMAQLISAARIGRSLGVHLILATQKPTGVVDDQIWSNSRFRVCLKVQERSDSAEMLKRPDAAEIKDTGRFYLQVGFNDLFELGQSAWCGAPYIPAEQVEKKRDDSVAVVDDLGRVLLEVRPKSEAMNGGTSQVVAIVRYLSELGKAENVSARQLWLPPIPEWIYLDDLTEKYLHTVQPCELNPIIGEYDDPFNQFQGLLTLPFAKNGNALLYGVAGSGKTTFLNTMLVDLLRSYDAQHLNIYIVDLGEETLRVFEDAPQIGNVLLSSDGERILGLFKMLREEIARRKARFAEGNGDYQSYCQSGGIILPQILVIIRNYAAFAEQFESLDDALIQITRECNKYGIYFLITANAANTVRYRVAQNFGTVYALQLNDTSDYIGIFGGTGGVYPSKLEGRGIFKTDRVYEFQTAHFAKDSSQQALHGFVAKLSESSYGICARPIPMLPDRVVPSFFGDKYSESAIPIGIEKASLRPGTLDLSKSIITMVLSQNIDELGDTVQGICEQVAKLDGSLTVLDALGIVQESQEFSYNYLKAGFMGSIEELFKEMVRRNNTYKRAISEGRKAEAYAAEYIIVTGVQTLCESLSEKISDEWNTLLEKAEPYYNIRFIFCDNPKALSTYSSMPWYKKHISDINGVWVGDGIADQYTLRIGKLTNSMYSEIPPHYGYLVKRGKPVLMKLIVGEHSEEEMER